MTRIELAQSAWKAEVRPLHFIGIILLTREDDGTRTRIIISDFLLVLQTSALTIQPHPHCYDLACPRSDSNRQPRVFETRISTNWTTGAN